MTLVLQRSFTVRLLTGYFLATICLLATTMGATPTGGESAAKFCLVVAHRGYSAVAPENTLIALKKAIEIGAGGSEFDVYSSADGAIVVMHDEKVDRTTNGKGCITQLSLAEIKQLDAGSWKDRTFAGEPVPTLDEMLLKMKGTSCRPVIEIKGCGIAKKVVDAVRTADMIDSAVIISFHAREVAAVRTLEPRIPCAWLCGQFPENMPHEQYVDWLVCQAKECKTDFVDLSHKMLSADLVAQLKSRGLTVWAWTVDDPKEMDQVIGWGVASITTNRPDVLQSRLREAVKNGP